MYSDLKGVTDQACDSCCRNTGFFFELKTTVTYRKSDFSHHAAGQEGEANPLVCT